MAAKFMRQKRTLTSSIPNAPTFINHSIFDALPDSAFIRQSQLVQSSKRPDSLAPLPFSAPTLWRKVHAGTFPKPIKLSERVTCWQVGSVREWMAAKTQSANGGMPKREQLATLSLEKSL